jgi:hypothetical protein
MSRRAKIIVVVAVIALTYTILASRSDGDSTS